METSTEQSVAEPDRNAPQESRVTIPFNPSTVATLKAVATTEHRTLAGQMRVIVDDWLDDYYSDGD